MIYTESANLTKPIMGALPSLGLSHLAALCSLLVSYSLPHRAREWIALSDAGNSPWCGRHAGWLWAGPGGRGEN